MASACALLSGFLSGCHTRSKDRHSFMRSSLESIFRSFSSFCRASLLASSICRRSSEDGAAAAAGASPPRLRLRLRPQLLLEELWEAFLLFARERAERALPELREPFRRRPFLLFPELRALPLDREELLPEEQREDRLLPEDSAREASASCFLSPAMAREPAWGDRARLGSGMMGRGTPAAGGPHPLGGTPGTVLPTPGGPTTRAGGAAFAREPVKPPPLVVMKPGGTPPTGRRLRACGFPWSPRINSKLTTVPAMFAVLRPSCRLSRAK
mmetsp:Transcript_67234/g.199920  ORF Transcript_67234/g.199920 Transcript_67234/m.199920 type:complete len:270 (-) Transcript_67234:217-1026(-)